MGHLPYINVLIIFLAISVKCNPIYSNSIPIMKLIYNNNGLGAYSFEFETGDGTHRQEDGGIDQSGALVVRGQFSYIDPNGHVYRVSYIADSNGYRPLHEEDTRFNDRKIV